MSDRRLMAVRLGMMRRIVVHIQAVRQRVRIVVSWQTVTDLAAVTAERRLGASAVQWIQNTVIAAV